MSLSDTANLAKAFLPWQKRVKAFDPTKIGRAVNGEKLDIEKSALDVMRPILQQAERNAIAAHQMGQDPSEAAGSTIRGTERMPGLKSAILAMLIASNLTGRRRSVANLQDRTAINAAVILLLIGGGDGTNPDAAIVELEQIYTPQSLALTEQIATRIQDQLSVALAPPIASELPGTEPAEVPPERQPPETIIRQTLERIGLAVPTPEKPSSDYNMRVVNEAAVSTAYNKGRETVETDNEVKTLIKGYLYRTMRDNRVRPSHRKMEGVTRRRDDPVWFWWTPPCGFNCRCIRLEIFIGEEFQETEVPDVLPDAGWWGGTYHGPGFAMD